MVDVSEKVLMACKAELVKLSKKWATGVTMGRAWSLEGECIGGKSYTACHAWIGHMYRKYVWLEGAIHYEYLGSGGYKYRAMPYKKNVKPFLIGSCHSKTRSKNICSVESHEAIILWMASDECPLSQYILNRDDKDSLLNGGIIILCGPGGATEPEALWLCKVLRYGVEGGQALDVWNELYKGGVHPLLALVVATEVRTVQGATFGYTGANGHSSVFSYKGSGVLSEKCIADILLGKSNPDAGETHSVFINPERQKGLKFKDLDLQGFCKPVQKSDGWGGTVNANGADKQEFINRVLEFQHKLEKELDISAPTKQEPGKDTVYLDLDM